MMLDTSTKRLRVNPPRVHRDAAFYDNLVRERSPFTGVLEAPRISRGATPVAWGTADTSSTMTDPFEEATFPHGGPAIRRIHMVAATLVVLLTGAITLATLSGYGTARADAIAVVPVEMASASPARTAPAVTPAPAVSIPTAEPVADSPAPQPNAAPPKTEPAMVVPAAAPEAPAKASYDEMLARAKKGPFKKRVQLLREAIAAYPEKAEAMARLSVMLMERPRERAEALELATRAAAIDDNNAMAWLAVGYIHQMTGNDQASRAAYVKCAQADGPKRFVRDCKSLI